MIPAFFFPGVVAHEVGDQLGLGPLAGLVRDQMMIPQPGERGIRAGGVPGEFYFRANIHEPGPQAVLGRRYSQEGLRQGESVLADLAHSAATARHLATFPSEKPNVDVR